jgi:transposase
MEIACNSSVALEEEILQLREENRLLRLRNQELEALLKEALDKLNKNSGNSSRPPSSDPFRKNQSLRTASGKRPGGQKGHPGTTLQMREVPDSIQVHDVARCSHCQRDLTTTVTQRYERRQVYELPPLQLWVTEHRSLVKVCPRCGEVNRGVFPVEVTQPVQYGERLKALCVYLTNYQLLPYHRCAQLLKDLLGYSPSEATLADIAEGCSAALWSFERSVKEALLLQKVLSLDETGYRFCGKTGWLHVTATGDYTLYQVHSRRGIQALDHIGILPQYQGVAMHDYWKAYLEYGCEHVFCHAHHLRDLTFCIEAENSHWAAQMKALLTRIHQSVEQQRLKGETTLSIEAFAKYHQAYWKVMEEGAVEHPRPMRQDLPGRVAKSKSRNLWERFYEYASEMLRFACDFSIPFTNNVAEQAVRMMRVKQKISGCFRSTHGAENFARIRSYIDTLRKQGLPIVEHLKKAMTAQAWMPMLPAPV